MGAPLVSWCAIALLVAGTGCSSTHRTADNSPDAGTAECGSQSVRCEATCFDNSLISRCVSIDRPCSDVLDGCPFQNDAASLTPGGAFDGSLLARDPTGAAEDCEQPLLLDLDCECGGPGAQNDPCWERVGEHGRVYRDAECAAQGSAAANKVDFTASSLFEWCQPVGGCTGGPTDMGSTVCEATATVRFGYESCAGCSTQRELCVRALIPAAADAVTVEAVPSECDRAPY